MTDERENTAPELQSEIPAREPVPEVEAPDVAPTFVKAVAETWKPVTPKTIKAAPIGSFGEQVPPGTVPGEVVPDWARDAYLAKKAAEAAMDEEELSGKAKRKAAKAAKAAEKAEKKLKEAEEEAEQETETVPEIVPVIIPEILSEAEQEQSGTPAEDESPAETEAPEAPAAEEVAEDAAAAEQPEAAEPEESPAEELPEILPAALEIPAEQEEPLQYEEQPEESPAEEAEAEAEPAEEAPALTEEAGEPEEEQAPEEAEAEEPEEDEEKTEAPAKAPAEKKKKKGKGVILYLLLILLIAFCLWLLFRKPAENGRNAQESRRLEEESVRESSWAAERAAQESSRAAEAAAKESSRAAERAAEESSRAAERAVEESSRAAEEAAKEIEYQTAQALFQSGKYEEAAQVFRALGDYGNSQGMLKSCQDALVGARYQEALALMEAGDYAKAAVLFRDLGSYSDSEAKMTECEKKQAKADFIDKLVPGTKLLFGTYEQDGDKSAKEAIEWLILDKKGTRVLLLSQKALTGRGLHSSRSAVTWESCSTRTWLNSDFLKEAFTEEQQAAIVTTHITTPDNYRYGTKGGKDTEDKIFLLSLEEAKQYLSKDQLICSVTPAAKASGAWASQDGTCWWWLRNTGSITIYAAHASYYGTLDEEGYYVDDKGNAIRPALWLDLAEINADLKQ